MNVGWVARDVQDRLGHVNIGSTLVYAKVSNARREHNFSRVLASAQVAGL